MEKLKLINFFGLKFNKYRVKNTSHQIFFINDHNLIITEYSIADKTIYSQGCTANKLACEVGDLNGKFGEKLDIVESPSVSRKFYTDDIPLSGAYSVIRRSVTIHMKNAAAPRYVCADIKRKVCILHIITNYTFTMYIVPHQQKQPTLIVSTIENSTVII